MKVPHWGSRTSVPPDRSCGRDGGREEDARPLNRRRRINLRMKKMTSASSRDSSSRTSIGQLLLVRLTAGRRRLRCPPAAVRVSGLQSFEPLPGTLPFLAVEREGDDALPGLLRAPKILFAEREHDALV